MVVPWSSSEAARCAERRLVLRIRRRTSADQQPHADHRLLVMQHRDHLQPVRQRPHFVGRELDLARRRAAAAAPPMASSALATCRARQRASGEQATHAGRAPCSSLAPLRPLAALALDGMIVITIRFSGVK